MEKLKRKYSENLVALAYALESARKALNHKSDGASETLKRIARALQNSGATYGLPDVSDDAKQLASLNGADLQPALDRLTTTLKRRIAELGVDKEHILIIEDDRIGAKLLKKTLEHENREVHVASDTDEARNILAEYEISLIILDLNLPEEDGRNFLIDLRLFPGTAMLPVVILTASPEEQAESECFALGADLFFRKPYHVEAFGAAIASKLQQMIEFSRQARQDPLTGLPNRAAFADVFTRAESYAVRRKEPLSVGMLDLDRFKLVNDNYGHAMGDEVLRRLAAVMKVSLRKSDHIARWGGEEFVVLLPNTEPEGGALAVEKALKALRMERFVAEDGTEFSVSFSAGIATVPPNAALEVVIAEADRRLYLAKEQGRNRVVCER